MEHEEIQRKSRNSGVHRGKKNNRRFLNTRKAR